MEIEQARPEPIVVYDTIDGHRQALHRFHPPLGWNREEPTKKDREEMGMFGWSAIEPCFHQVRRLHPEWEPQPCFLWTCRLISQALRGREVRGPRDEALEDDLASGYLRHYGVGLFLR